MLATGRRPSGADLVFMDELLAALARDRVAAPAPIEQRWTASSRSPMSPASAPGAPGTVHSWVGIIMYLPTEDASQRAAITDRRGGPGRGREDAGSDPALLPGARFAAAFLRGAVLGVFAGRGEPGGATISAYP